MSASRELLYSQFDPAKEKYLWARIGAAGARRLYGQRGELGLLLYQWIDTVDFLVDESPHLSPQAKFDLVCSKILLISGCQAVSHPDSTEKAILGHPGWKLIPESATVNSVVGILSCIAQDAQYLNWEPRQAKEVAANRLSITTESMNLGSLIFNRNPARRSQRLDRFVTAASWLHELKDFSENLAHGSITVPLTEQEIDLLKNLPNGDRPIKVKEIYPKGRYNKDRAKLRNECGHNVLGFFDTGWPAWQQYGCATYALATLQLTPISNRYPKWA